MTGKTHALIGFGAGMVIASNGGALITLAGGLLGGVVALTPDIDHRHSTISHRVGLLGLPFRLFGHRTITHALWIPLIMGVTMVIYPHWMLFVICGAYTSHIIADMVTMRGVPLFYPLSRRSWGLPLIRTGGFLEWIVSLGVAVGILLYLWEMSQ
jgi:inner membrane protein